MTRDLVRTILALAFAAAACSQANPPPKGAQDCTEPLRVAATPPPAPAARHHGHGQFERGRGRALKHWDRNRDGRLEIAELPPGQRERWAAADRDGDGALSRDELRAFHGRRAMRHFEAADENGDGALDQGEVDPRRWARLRAADADGDGKVTREELGTALAGRKLGRRRGHEHRHGRGRHERGAPRN